MKRFYKKIMDALFVIPIPVFVVIVTVLNYCIGYITTNINKTYSSVAEFTRSGFYNTLVKYIVLFAMLQVLNSLVWKICNMKTLNRNYMKWIEKLSYSKVSSITSIGTGGINNAINIISQCDKNMMNNVIRILPMIVPFVMLCKEEYNIAGIVPVIINVSYIIIMLIFNIIICNLKCNVISAKANAKMHSVSSDCIYNSKTIKYFNKEKWCIDKQIDTQKDTFSEMLNLKRNFFLTIIYQAFSWVPTLLNVYICWNNMSAVLFILMSDYCLTNISDSITEFLNYYGDRKSNLKILGKLDSDTQLKKPLEKLVVKDLIFKYSPDSKVEFRIDNITIRKGHRYCITGKSGFGKSTFIKLLTRTVVPSPESGQVDFVDTIYMFAESEMFNDTIMENVSLGDSSVTEEEVTEILKRMEVDIDLDISKDSIGEKGELLSTGQRQRINLARVIVYARRHPGVLVALDEVTSALDEVTSINCIKYITEEFERLGTTLLYVSNKSDYKDTNLITDNIYVRKDGDIVTYVQE